jgi:hypothetical protein
MALNGSDGKGIAGIKGNDGKTYQSQAEADQANKVLSMQKQINTYNDFQKLQNNMAANHPPGWEQAMQSENELKAGVVPTGFQGMIDPKTGKVLDQYKVDPFSGQASQQLRSEALSTGPSALAKGMLGKQAFDENLQRGKVGLQTQTANSNAQAQLARMGGFGGGARALLARGGARDAMLANQQVGAQGAQQRYDINNQDMQRKQTLLGQTADVERAGDTANLQTVKDTLGAKAQYDSNRYNQQMQAWAAKQSADATRAAGGGGGKK